MQLFKQIQFFYISWKVLVSAQLWRIVSLQHFKKHYNIVSWYTLLSLLAMILSYYSLVGQKHLLSRTFGTALVMVMDMCVY